MQVSFHIQRQSTERPSWFETYRLDVNPSLTILDCLNQIKWEQDGSLAFRKNCRNTICGSCAIVINGQPALACKQTLQSELGAGELRAEVKNGSGLINPLIDINVEKAIPEISIQPLNNFPVIKDLVVDMGKFWQNLAQVDPYVSTAGRVMPEREFLQLPTERATLDQVGNCILCGACYSECNAKTVNPEFVGPHALAKAFRVLSDSRDGATDERLTHYGQTLSGVWGCTRCFNCNSACPMEVAPLDQITRIKSQVLARSSSSPPRAVRHRQAMIDLVTQGGWIDERRFGLVVVGNRFRDLKGLWSLVPLGLQMVRHGKFPTHFDPSSGAASVQALIHSIKIREAQMLETKMQEPLSLGVLQMASSSHNSNISVPEHSQAQGDDLSPLEPKLGWTAYAEQINGRFAMVGVLILLLLEFFTHQDFFTWLGLR